MNDISVDFASILDETIKEEYGGCDPRTDDPCILKARIVDNTIQVFVVGKWRGVKRYRWKKKMPSKKIQKEMESVIRINTGTTFDGKEIMFCFPDLNS